LCIVGARSTRRIAPGRSRVALRAIASMVIDRRRAPRGWGSRGGSRRGFSSPLSTLQCAPMTSIVHDVEAQRA
jgi:hypothetical protein